MSDDALIAAIRRQLIQKGDCLFWDGKYQQERPVIRRNGQTVYIWAKWTHAHGAKQKLIYSCGNAMCFNPNHWAAGNPSKSPPPPPQTKKTRILIAKHRLAEWEELAAQQENEPE